LATLSHAIVTHHQMDFAAVQVLCILLKIKWIIL